MAGLDNLVGKITDQANEEAKNILEVAKKEADIIKTNAKAELEKQIKKLEAKNEQGRNLAREQLKSNAQLRARNDKLATKQSVINTVFEAVYEELKNMDDEVYLEFVKKHIRDDLSEIVVKKDKLDICKANLEGIKISEERFAESGFIESTDEIENNYTFESRINTIREEVEGQLAKILFD